MPDIPATICRCALEKGRMLHRGDCPLYPGEPLRMTAAQFREHAGLSDPGQAAATPPSA